MSLSLKGQSVLRVFINDSQQNERYSCFYVKGATTNSTVSSLASKYTDAQTIINTLSDGHITKYNCEATYEGSSSAASSTTPIYMTWCIQCEDTTSKKTYLIYIPSAKTNLVNENGGYIKNDSQTYKTIKEKLSSFCSAEGNDLELKQIYVVSSPSKVLPTCFKTEAIAVKLDGDAKETDVVEKKTFYNTDASKKLTGTLKLSGSAQTTSVLEGFTFYNTDVHKKLTGTYVPKKNDKSEVIPKGPGGTLPVIPIMFNIPWELLAIVPAAMWLIWLTKLWSEMIKIKPKTKNGTYAEVRQLKIYQYRNRITGETLFYTWRGFGDTIIETPMYCGYPNDNINLTINKTEQGISFYKEFYIHPPEGIYPEEQVPEKITYSFLCPLEGVDMESLEIERNGNEETQMGFDVVVLQ